MSVFARFKKILTWTIMSTTVITMLTLPTAMGSEANDFGFKIIKQQEEDLLYFNYVKNEDTIVFWSCPTLVKTPFVCNI